MSAALLPNEPGPADPARPGDAAPAPRGLAMTATAMLAAGTALLAAVGLAGPSAAVPATGSAAPWPPYFTLARPSDLVVTGAMTLAVLLGGGGLMVALLAARRGWRPSLRALIGCGLLAVIAFVLLPPVGSTDILDYAVYGRIAALGHSPYRMTPAKLAAAGDPVGAYAPPTWRSDPSVYGPLATASEQAASGLAGPSAARTVFWIKVWNGLAYLAVMLALDRVLRSDPAGRVRAHLLWTVNPLMLFAALAGGHVDGLGAALGILGLLCLRRLSFVTGLGAGLLTGAAIATKASFLLYLAGVAWVARRSPRTLAGAGLGLAAVLAPSYLLGGRAAVAALVSRATSGPDVYQPWRLVTRALGLDTANVIPRFDNAVALAATVILAIVLLWRLPPGWSAAACARPALAVSLAWVFCSPQQRPWYDAMIFPLLALMPATRLDWIVVARAVAGALAELPGVSFYTQLRPHGLLLVADIVSRTAVPAALIALAAALVWLCVTGRWQPRPGPRRVFGVRPAGGPVSPPGSA